MSLSAPGRQSCRTARRSSSTTRCCPRTTPTRSRTNDKDAGMNFTDIFVKKPVLATVVSLLILVIGLRAALSLPVRQYPRTENAVVTVTTAYYGADPDVVAGFITQPLENVIAQANGIDYITSTSTNSLSTITVNLRLNYDYNRAVTEITSKMSSVLNRLPPQSQQPALQVQVGQAISAMYLGFRSSVLQPNQITDRSEE